MEKFVNLRLHSSYLDYVITPFTLTRFFHRKFFILIMALSDVKYKIEVSFQFQSCIETKVDLPF